MKQVSRGLRMSILVGVDGTWHHKPLYHEIVRRARDAGLAGTTVLRGIEGFGAGAQVHTTRLLDLGEHLPISVIVVDTEARVRAFLPQLDELVSEGAVLLNEVEMVRYSRDDKEEQP